MLTTQISLEVNGQAHELTVPGHWSLLDALREILDLTGAKRGCDRGECGSCTVLLDGKPVYACITLAAQVRGREVVTVEGLAHDGRLDPVQQAFPRRGRRAMRLLHAGFPDVGPRPAGRHTPPRRRRNPRSPLRQPLPLQRLRTHPPVRPRRRRARVMETAMYCTACGNQNPDDARFPTADKPFRLHRRAMAGRHRSNHHPVRIRRRRGGFLPTRHRVAALS